MGDAPLSDILELADDVIAFDLQLHQRAISGSHKIPQARVAVQKKRKQFSPLRRFNFGSHPKAQIERFAL